MAWCFCGFNAAQDVATSSGDTVKLSRQGDSNDLTGVPLALRLANVLQCWLVDAPTDLSSRVRAVWTPRWQRAGFVAVAGKWDLSEGDDSLKLLQIAWPVASSSPAFELDRELDFRGKGLAHFLCAYEEQEMMPVDEAEPKEPGSVWLPNDDIEVLILDVQSLLEHSSGRRRLLSFIKCLSTTPLVGHDARQLIDLLHSTVSAALGQEAEGDETKAEGDETKAEEERNWQDVLEAAISALEVRELADMLGGEAEAASRRRTLALVDLVKKETGFTFEDVQFEKTWSERPLKLSEMVMAARDVVATVLVMEATEYPNLTRVWANLEEVRRRSRSKSRLSVATELSLLLDGSDSAAFPLIRDYDSFDAVERPLGMGQIASDLREIYRVWAESTSEKKDGLAPIIFSVDDPIHQASLSAPDDAMSVCVVKSITFRWNGRCHPDARMEGANLAPKQVPIVAVLPLWKRVEVGALRKLIWEHFGLETKAGQNPSVGKIRMCPEKELVKEFGQVRWCIGPLGLRFPTSTIVVFDRTLLDFQYVFCGAGRPDVNFAVDPRVYIHLVENELLPTRGQKVILAGEEVMIEKKSDVATA